MTDSERKTWNDTVAAAYLASCQPVVEQLTEERWASHPPKPDDIRRNILELKLGEGDDLCSCCRAIIRGGKSLTHGHALDECEEKT